MKTISSKLEFLAKNFTADNKQTILSLIHLTCVNDKEDFEAFATDRHVASKITCKIYEIKHFLLNINQMIDFHLLDNSKKGDKFLIPSRKSTGDKTGYSIVVDGCENKIEKLKYPDFEQSLDCEFFNVNHNDFYKNAPVFFNGVLLKKCQEMNRKFIYGEYKVSGRLNICGWFRYEQFVLLMPQRYI